MSDVRVVVEVEVNPTESLEKVRSAVENLFPRASFEVVEDRIKGLLVAKTEGRDGLAQFHAILRQERILDAARRVLLKGRRENRITFHLNKQVAYVKRVSFCEPFDESPLGPIRVEMECDDPSEIIEWLAPRTRKK